MEVAEQIKKKKKNPIKKTGVGLHHLDKSQINTSIRAVKML